LGLISIVVASAALIGDLLWALMPMWTDMLTEELNGSPAPPPLRVGPGSVWLRVGVLVVNVLLLIAGGVTMARGRVGRRLHVVYGILASLVALAGVGYAVRMHDATLSWLAQHPDNEVAAWIEGITVSPALMLIAGLVVVLAWPVFCLAWFGFAGRSPDEGLPERAVKGPEASPE
jgi:uncharacterized membrane protein YkgB